MIQRSFRLNPEVSKALDIYCANAGITLQALMVSLISGLIPDLEPGGLVNKLTSYQVNKLTSYPESDSGIGVDNHAQPSETIDEVSETELPTCAGGLFSSGTVLDSTSLSTSTILTCTHRSMEIEGVQGGKEACKPRKSRNADKVYANDSETVGLPAVFDNRECREALRTWLKHKSERNQIYTRTGFNSMIAGLARKLSATEFVEAITHSLDMSYSGIFPAVTQSARVSKPRETNHERNMKVLYGDNRRREVANRIPVGDVPIDVTDLRRGDGVGGASRTLLALPAQTGSESLHREQRKRVRPDGAAAASGATRLADILSASKIPGLTGAGDERRNQKQATRGGAGETPRVISIVEVLHHTGDTPHEQASTGTSTSSEAAEGSDDGQARKCEA